MQIRYDEKKSRLNLAKHDVDLLTAALVFDDPYALTVHDVLHDEDEERYITLGEIAPGVILFVVHTWLEGEHGEEEIRLISARAATSREKRTYEETHEKSDAPDRRNRHKERLRHRSR